MYVCVCVWGGGGVRWEKGDGVEVREKGYVYFKLLCIIENIVSAIHAYKLKNQKQQLMRP